MINTMQMRKYTKMISVKGAIYYGKVKSIFYIVQGHIQRKSHAEAGTAYKNGWNGKYRF